jgi:hypothetical protein
MSYLTADERLPDRSSLEQPWVGVNNGIVGHNYCDLAATHDSNNGVPSESGIGVYAVLPTKHDSI